MTVPLRIDVWSDIACPWCLVGKRRLEAALRDFPHGAQVIFHAFELDPSAPRERDRSVSHVERIARKYGMSVAQAKAANDRLVAMGEAEGIEFDFQNIRSGNTFDAHRLVHLGKERGIQGAVKERLLRGYLEQGEAIGDTTTLVRLGVEAGLDEGEATDVMASDLYADAVRGDEAMARELGISGVPFFVFDGRLAVSGAQPVHLFTSALHQAQSTREDELAAPAPELQEGAVCGPDGC